jgi:hypothetical protein
MGGAVVSIARYIALDCFLLALLAVVLTACGTASSIDSAATGPEEITVPGGIPPPGFDAQLPPPSALLSVLGGNKRTSYDEEDYIRHGNQLNSSLPLQNAAPVSNYVQFDTDWSAATGMDPADLGFCCFSFDNLSAFTRDPEVRYGWSFPPADIGTAWLALADWDLDAWVWHQCTAEGVCAVSSFDSYISPTDQLLVLVLMANAQKSSLRWIRLGPKLVTAELSIAPTSGVVPVDIEFDASASSPGVGTTVYYGFDFDEDGEFDYSGLLATTDHTETAPGLHNYTVTVRNGWGVEALAAAQFAASGPWTHSWGGSDNEAINAVVTDGQEYIYAVGSTISFGEGMDDLLVLKYNIAGDLIWAKIWGGTNWDVANAAYFADDSLYVAGLTASFGAGQNDILLQRWTPDGSLSWSRVWGGSKSDAAYALDGRPDNLYVVGDTGSYGAGGSDVVVLNCDLDGTVLWDRTWGGTDVDRAAAAEVAFNHISLVTSIHIAGHSSSYGPEASNVLYLKFKDDGTILTQRTWSGSSLQSASCLSVYGLLQDVFIGGDLSSGGDSDLLLLQVGNDEAWTWGGDGNDLAFGMFRQGDNIFVCGKTNSFHTSYAGLRLLFEPDGTLVNSLVWKSTAAANDSLTAICAFPGHGLLLGGAGAQAEGSAWSLASATLSTEPGGWSDHSVVPGEPSVETETAAAAVVDITEAVIDSGGGWTDAIVAAYPEE